MSFGPVRAARIDFADPAAPAAPDFGDIYHPRVGALQQARHVFLLGNGLPARWADRPRFVVLETGFGLGNNFLATWAAWRDDPRRCARLWFVSIEKHPPARDDLVRAHQNSPLPDLAAALQAQWPASTPDLHLIDFDGGSVRLLLVLADVARALPQLLARVDAFFLDGFAPARNPAMWDARMLRGLNRLAADDATLATWSVAGEMRAALTTAGFDLRKAPGSGGKREITVGRFAPHHVPAVPPGRRAAAAVEVLCAAALPASSAGASAFASNPRQAVVVGAGLAGAATAFALAAQGIATLVVDRRLAPALEASGNPAGLYHGIAHAGDGVHARWLRACALWAARCYSPLVAAGLVAGRTDGLLRGEQRLSLDAMHGLLEAQALPASWLQAWPAERAAQRSGVPWSRPAWFHPQGGWVSPRALVDHWLGAEGIAFRGGVEVQRLRRLGDRWQLLNAAGQVLADAAVLVLANAADLIRLIGHSPGPWQRTRGQVSLCHAAGVALPLPLADNGYALQLGDGRLLFGATSQIDDDHAAVRHDDHTRNLQTLERLTGRRPAADDLAGLQGKVGWRMHAADRLPWIGPVPDFDHPASGRRDHARLVPRQPGLYVLCGLGSRGLTQAPLAGELLASWITGAPMPAPAGLVDAVDVARFVARAARVNRS